MPLAPPSLAIAKLPSFVRAMLVGLVATAVDLTTLAILVEGAHVSPAAANVPALLVGLAVQFFGCRLVVFPEGARSLRAQLTGFLVAEAGTLALNALSFHLLVTLTRAPYALARPVGQLVVFVMFSFPAWRRVFRGKR
jgi:putative flippase GtrA